MRIATDSRVALDDLWPGEGSRLANAVALARNPATRASVAEQFVRERIALSAHAGDGLVRSCVARIEDSRGRVRGPKRRLRAG